MYSGGMGYPGAAFNASSNYSQQPVQQQQAQYNAPGVMPIGSNNMGFGTLQQPTYPQAQTGGFQHTGIPSGDKHAEAKKEWPYFQGNSACIQSCFASFPSNRQTKNKVRVPLTITCKPLGRLLDEEGNELECPVTDVPPGGSIIRCTAPNCRAYMNPFALWVEDSRKWKCPNCSRINDLMTRSKEYFISRLDEHSRRIDRYQRPELHSGTMEFVAPQEYTMRPPMRPTFCFLIDVTRQSVQRGVVDSICHAIKESIKLMAVEPGESHERAQVMICTYDTDTHVYQLPKQREDGSWTAPTVLTHPGACEPYAISSHTNQNIIVEVQGNKDRICRLLDAIPEIWRIQAEHRNGLGSSLKEMELYLSKVGGRILTFVASRPSVGDINTAVTPDGERMQAKSEPILKPANRKWRQLGFEMAQDKEAHCPVGVEMYCFLPGPNEQSLDLPTLLQLPAASGHAVYQFDASQYENIEHDRLFQSICWSIVQSNIAWECCVRVRVSRGWKIPNDVEGWNNFDSQEIRDSLVSYPCLAEDISVSFALELQDSSPNDEKFTDGHVHIQVALLYTSTQGSRRIRLQSLAIPVVQNPVDVWNSVSPANLFQQLAFTSLWHAKQSYYKAIEYLNVKLEQIYQSMKQAGYEYTDVVIRDVCLYALGLTKTTALRDISRQGEITPDSRVLAWYNFQRMLDTDSLLANCYPHDATEEEIDQFTQRIMQGRAGTSSIGVPVPAAGGQQQYGMPSVPAQSQQQQPQPQQQYGMPPMPQQQQQLRQQHQPQQQYGMPPMPQQPQQQQPQQQQQQQQQYGMPPMPQQQQARQPTPPQPQHGMPPMPQQSQQLQPQQHYGMPPMPQHQQQQQHAQQQRPW